MDASAAGGASHSLTPHRSPLGLTFDVTGSMPSDYAGDGFVMSWTAGTAASNDLLTPFNDPGEDLLHLEFVAPDTVMAHRIAWGFSGPTDAVLRGNRMYVIEIGGSNGLWELHFTGGLAGEPAPEDRIGLHVSPNPLQSAGSVVLDVPRDGEYAVHVLDLLGRALVALHEGSLPAGRRAFVLDGERLQPGSYIVRVAGPYGSTARLIVRR
jgi:hypothetical protein